MAVFALMGLVIAMVLVMKIMLVVVMFVAVSVGMANVARMHHSSASFQCHHHYDQRNQRPGSS